MRSLIACLLALHGVAHFVGVRAAFGPGPMRPRLIPVPRALEGAAWLVLGLGFVASAALLYSSRGSALALLLGLSGGSLLMCLLAWPEARIGVVVDGLLLILTLLLSPTDTRSHLASAFERELEQTGAATRAISSELIDESTLASLPAPTQRYLRFMGVLGRRRDRTVQASFTGEFRRDGGEWLPCEAIQLDRREPVTRIFMMKLRLASVLPVTVRDEYLNGRGTLEAKALDLFTVTEGSGHELDVGELVTYLNDALLLAPSLLLDARTSWTAVDADTFDVALTDGTLTVKGRVSLDARGAPLTFSTTDRFFETAKGQWLRTEWQTPVDGWQDVNGRKLPTRARAVWQLASGPFAYAKVTFAPERILFNEP